MHSIFAVECKYGRQIPKYCIVDTPTELNKEYVLLPSSKMDCLLWNCEDLGYDLGFLQKGMAQAQQYNEDKIPLLCLKPPYYRGFIMVMWKDDYLSFVKNGHRILDCNQDI